MRKNIIKVLLVLIAISSIYSTFVYLTVSDALGNRILTYMTNYANYANSDMFVRNESDIDIVRRVCDVEVDDYENLFIKISNCDQKKLKELGDYKSNPSPYTYFSLSFGNAASIIANNFLDFIKENYPNERFFISEKLADLMVLLNLISHFGKVYTYNSALIGSCYQNESLDIGCTNSLFDATGKSIVSIEKDIVFDDNFVESCLNQISNENNQIDNKVVCNRMKVVYEYMREKSLSTPDLDRNGRFLITIIFYSLSKPEFYAYQEDEVFSSLTEKISEELDPQFVNHFNEIMGN